MNRYRDITEQILIDNNFENITKNHEAEYWKTSEYAIQDFSEWRKDTSEVDGDNYVIINMKKGITNNGADWGVHIDNYFCASIGSADISTTWQFNMLMKIFGSKFRL